MTLHVETKALLQFLKNNPAIRHRIKSPPNMTILYAGQLNQPAWREIMQMRARYPQLVGRKMLPEVLESIQLVGAPFRNLLLWVQSLKSLEPKEHNEFIGWRALSGIFASNAAGAVSFVIGSGITKKEKVFAATEVSVLLRNPNIDATAKDLLAYYQRCIQNKDPNLNLSFIAG